MKREWASALGHEPTAGEPSSWAMLANQLANSNEVRSDVLTAMLVDFESHIKNSVWTLAPESVMENFDAVALKLRSLADFLRPRFDLLDKTKVIVAKDLRALLSHKFADEYTSIMNDSLLSIRSNQMVNKLIAIARLVLPLIRFDTDKLMECFELVAGVLTTKALEAPPTGKYYYDAHGNGRSLFISEFLDTELSEVPFSRLEILLTPPFYRCLQLSLLKISRSRWSREILASPTYIEQLLKYQSEEGQLPFYLVELLEQERKLDSSLLFETIKQRLEDPKIDEDFIYILTTAKTSPIALHNNPLSLIDRSFDLNGGWLETIWNLLSIKTLLSKWSYHVEFRFAYRAFKKCRNTANFQERARLIVADWSDRTCLDPFGVKEKYFRKIYDMLDEEGRNCLVLNSLVSQRLPEVWEFADTGMAATVYQLITNDKVPYTALEGKYWINFLKKINELLPFLIFNATDYVQNLVRQDVRPVLNYLGLSDSLLGSERELFPSIGKCANMLEEFFPIRDVTTWTPETHRFFPKKSRDRVFSVLCIHGLTDHPLSALPKDVLYCILASLENHVTVLDLVEDRNDLATMFSAIPRDNRWDLEVCQQIFEYLELILYLSRPLVFSNPDK